MHMLTCAITKSKAGSKAYGLWTAKSGHAETPGRGLVSLNPRVRYVEQYTQKKRPTGTNLRLENQSGDR